MKIIDRIDRKILIKPKRKYVTVEYDALYWGILELSSDAVEAIYNFAKTLPLQRSSMHAFGGRFIASMSSKVVNRSLRTSSVLWQEMSFLTYSINSMPAS
jgi:hypothetical protein